MPIDLFVLLVTWLYDERSVKKNVGTNQIQTTILMWKKDLFFKKKGCYKEGSRTKTYSVSIKSDLHQEQIAFQETDYYKEKQNTDTKYKTVSLKIHGYDRYHRMDYQYACKVR
jgi:hypothetical protein